MLVPGTGASAIFGGDESESDIDLEWSGGIATGANLVFVYTGDFLNNGVFDSIQYAVDEDIAPIISLSYGACEPEFTAAEIQAYEAVGAQAVAQGMTFIASSGDSGSTACSGFTSLTTAQQEAEAVNYPASSAYATAAGGTETTAAEDVTTNPPGYWKAANGSDVLDSALQYIPEVAWNDDSSQYGLSSSGGGASAFIDRPAWQAGVPGIPSGSMRLVPDMALYSSPDNPRLPFLLQRHFRQHHRQLRERLPRCQQHIPDRGRRHQLCRAGLRRHDGPHQRGQGLYGRTGADQPHPLQDGRRKRRPIPSRRSMT